MSCYSNFDLGKSPDFSNTVEYKETIKSPHGGAMGLDDVIQDPVKVDPRPRISQDYKACMCTLGDQQGTVYSLEHSNGTTYTIPEEYQKEVFTQLFADVDKSTYPPLLKQTVIDHLAEEYGTLELIQDPGLDIINQEPIDSIKSDDIIKELIDNTSNGGSSNGGSSNGSTSSIDSASTVNSMPVEKKEDKTLFWGLIAVGVLLVILIVTILTKGK